MSKRLNPHRRLMQRQQRLFREAMQAFGPSHDDSHKLQQGVVRSALAPRVHLTAYATPQDGLWEGTGKRGKVVRGKFVATKVTKVQKPPELKLPKAALQAIEARKKARAD